MVFNDGATYLQADGYYRAVNVLDNLIYRRELPLMAQFEHELAGVPTRNSVRTASIEVTRALR